MNFVARSTFSFTQKLLWYPGHQAKALRQLEKGIGHIDIIIEVRDARIPLTSTNPQFEKVLGNRPRLIVFNKSDLADMNTKTNLITAYKSFKNQSIAFTCSSNDSTIKEIIQFAKNMVSIHPQKYPTLSMVGLPNVGKSSLINKLRHIGVKKGKVSEVGPMAGVTRTVQTRVKIYQDPLIYMVDTPGIFKPYFLDPIDGLKIALTGGSKDSLTDDLYVADYLLFRLNLYNRTISKYVDFYSLDEPTNDIQQVLKGVALKYKLFLINSPVERINKSEAARRFVLDFRAGKLGNITLDDCSPKALDDWFSKEETLINQEIHSSSKILLNPITQLV